MVLHFIIPLTITFIAAFLFGLERQRSHKQVGFGTFIFVATGSCVLALLALEVSPESPLPLLGSIITGIGFLGAGALIKNNDKIFGFTTAASIWVFAAFGVVVGIGEYLLAGALYFFIWVVILYDTYLEKRGLGSYRTRLTIKTNKILTQEVVREFLAKVGIKKTNLISFEIDSNQDKCVLSYFVEGETKNIQAFPKLAKETKWIDSLKFD